MWRPSLGRFSQNLACRPDMIYKSLIILLYFWLQAGEKKTQVYVFLTFGDSKNSKITSFFSLKILLDTILPIKKHFKQMQVCGNKRRLCFLWTFGNQKEGGSCKTTCFEVHSMHLVWCTWEDFFPFFPGSQCVLTMLPLSAQWVHIRFSICSSTCSL
jgi:hypothetical protein